MVQDVSIREKMLESSPEWADTLANIAQMMQENNRKLIDSLLNEKRDYQAVSFLIPEDADITAVKLTAPFPIRGVIIDNKSGVTVYAGSSPINGNSEIEFISGAYMLCATAKTRSMPAHFDNDVWVRYASSVTYAASVWGRIWLLSQPCNVFYG